MIAMGILVAIALLSMLNRWEQKQEQKRSVDNERQRLAPYQFCNLCGTPLGDDEKFRLDSRVLCFDCSLGTMRELRPAKRSKAL